MTEAAALLCNYLVVGGLIFAIGLVGFVVRRNMIVMFLCAEMMLQGVSISLIAWGRYHGDWGGQILVLFIIAVAAAEAGIAMALAMMLFQKSGSLDIAFWQDLREEGEPRFTDRGIPEEREESRHWPTLTPAGLQPSMDSDEQFHRSQI
jgi:NADH-quinone oxidoreductase subunit K